MKQTLRRQRAALPRARVPDGLVPRSRRRAPRRPPTQTRELLFEAAAELGAHHIKVGNIPGTPCELPQLTERFGELCADAAKHTDAKIVYEFMPFDVNVKSVDAALAVVGGAGAANGGIAIDTWHMSKLGIPPDELRRIPPEYLSWVELSDGQFENMDDPIDEVVNHRTPAGRGRVRHARLHRGLPGSAATRAPGASRCSPRSCATTRST